MKPTAKIVVISVLLAFCSTCLANELLVPSQYSTIQSAIDAATDGDTVIVAPGIYTGIGNRDIDFLGKAITVRSADPNDPNIVTATIIDCNGTHSEPHRGFYFHNNEDADSIVDGFTITNGYGGNYGGGIYCYYGSSPTIINCNISGNSASSGGGIYCYSSSPTITNCTITGNTVLRAGGGIACYDGSPVITNCTISGNSTTAGYPGGGGICCMSSSPTIKNCTITGNTTVFNGGGILSDASSPTVTNCTFSRNLATEGGGMANYSSSATITNCTISENSAYGGGGMYNSSSSPTLTNCTFIGNNTSRDGGGLAYCSGPITNCTITGNSAKHYGGGLAYCSGPITNCTITGNSAKYYGGGLAYCSGPITNSIIWDNWPDQIYYRPHITIITYSNVQGGWAGLGNINADPCFVDDVNNDYHLKPASPCINTGDPNYVPGPNETDLDGLPRIIGGRIDMGAYEFNHQPVADAGPNQVVYADHTGLAAVTLDGSASYDDDGQDLTYKWTWTIDGNTFTSKGTDGIVNLLDFAAFAKQWPQSENPFADLSILTKAWMSTPASPNWNRLCDIAPAGAVLTIELPVGEHIIELIVGDGIDESGPDYCTITVIGPIRGKLMITPCVLETKSHDRWILATLYLSPVADEQVNTEEPLRLYPGGIEAKYQRFSRYGRPGHSYTIALAYFDKQQVIDALGPGQFEVSVVGKFLSGRFFFGSDNIKILSHKPPHYWY